jgi:Mrp family chromosome partitioning ATPase
VLESGALRSLMVEMHQEFDFLMVDAAPCLSTVDPFLFGHLCGGAVLTVRAHETLRSDVADALRVLEKNEVQPLGMVLTFAREFVPHLLRSR